MGTKGDIWGQRAIIRGKKPSFFATHFSFCHSFLVPAIRPYLTSGLEAGLKTSPLPSWSRGEIVPLQAESHSRTVTQWQLGYKFITKNNTTRLQKIIQLGYKFITNLLQKKYIIKLLKDKYIVNMCILITNQVPHQIIVAQGERVGPITRRSVDRNNPMISYFIFLIVKKWNT